jgi:hypothetical protein
MHVPCEDHANLHKFNRKNQNGTVSGAFMKLFKIKLKILSEVPATGIYRTRKLMDIMRS